MQTIPSSHRVRRQRGRAKVLSVPVIIMALCWLAPAAAQDMVEAALDAAGVPKVGAFLPNQYDVARTEPLPIDGVWRVNTINKKIRIEQGRAYAIDSWRHLFVLQISPGMVVMQDFRRTGAGVYMAEDLPLLGPATLTLNREGHLDVAVQGKLGPARYQLIRLDAQYPDALSHELTAMAGGAAPPSFAPPPVAPLPGMAPQPAAPVAPVSPIQPGAGAGSAPGQPLPGMPATAPMPLPAPVQQPAPPPTWTPPPAAAPPGVPAAPVPENCTPIGIDPDTGLTICA